MIKLVAMFAVLTSAAYAQANEGSRNFYLRCNATTWDVNDSNRLKSGVNGNLYTLAIDNKGLKEDDCVVMETNEMNAWGSEQHPLAIDRNSLSSGESANLRQVKMADESAAHFIVKYPSAGRFVFTFDLGTLRLTFNPESIIGLYPAATVSWEKSADVFADAAGNIFGAEPGNKFSRFDAVTGNTIWTIQGNEPIAYDNNCVTNDTIYLLRNEKVTAVNIVNGKTIWETDFSKQLDANSGFLSCFAKSKNLFFTHTQDQGTQTKIAGLDMATGNLLWTYEAKGSSGLLDATADHILLSQTQNDSFHTLVLDQKTGKTLWNRETGSEWLTIDRAGRLLLQSANRLSQVSFTSGKLLWNYTRPESTSTFLMNNLATNDLFLQHNDGITRLNPDNGKVMWFRNAASNLSFSAEVLASSKILYSESDYSKGISTFKVLDVATGADIWSRTDTTATTVAADNKGRVYLRSLSKLSRLSEAGKKIWTLTAPKPEGIDVNFGNLLVKSGSLYAIYFSQAGHPHFPPSGILSIGDSNGKLKWIHATPGPVNLLSVENPQVVTFKNFLNGVATGLKK